MKKMQIMEPSARDRILQTAHDLFYREGIRATGIDRIIREAGVTKVTFYRHFPSKNNLIAAYLEHRHALWMEWFINALECAPKDPVFRLAPVLFALRAWFSDKDYRGCAFINGVAELDGPSPFVREIALRHKHAMRDAIAALLPDEPQNTLIAKAAAMAVDGAILQAQMEDFAENALSVLEEILRSLPRALQRVSGS